MALFKAKDGTQIYYKDCGAGKPILFSHGWPLDGDMWDSQLNYLAERGFRAIAFDRRGFGRSEQPWNGYDYDTFASDINDLITTLDLRDVTLVGLPLMLNGFMQIKERVPPTATDILPVKVCPEKVIAAQRLWVWYSAYSMVSAIIDEVRMLVIITNRVLRPSRINSIVTC